MSFSFIEKVSHETSSVVKNSNIFPELALIRITPKTGSTMKKMWNFGRNLLQFQLQKLKEN